MQCKAPVYLGGFVNLPSSLSVTPHTLPRHRSWSSSLFTLNAGVQALTKPSGLQQKPTTLLPLPQPKPPSSLVQIIPVAS